MSERHSDQPPPDRSQLGMWDAVSIIVGIVIGVGIHETAPTIFGMVSSPWMALACWLAGGLLSLVGALCFAELAASIPRAGGDYHYLKTAFGSWAGYLFGWMNLSILKPAAIGMVLFIFAKYAGNLFGVDGTVPVFVPIAAAAGLSFINIAGIALGKGTQNALTALKLIGFAGIIVSGLFYGRESLSAELETGSTFDMGAIGLAMVFVLYAFGGWNDAALVTSEVRNPKKNIPRSLLIGVVIISAVYLLVNMAYIRGLGFEAAQGSKDIAARVLGLSLGSIGYDGMCLIIMVSALGAANGMIFTGARVYAALGEDFRLFEKLGRRNSKTGVPVTALVAEGTITVALIALVGSESGRSLINQFLETIGIAARKWSESGFDALLTGTAPIFWGLFFMTGLSVFVLRIRRPDLDRPFRVPLYPITPLLFCATTAYMLYRSADYAMQMNLLVFGAVPLAVGIVLYGFQRKKRSSR